jgi:hypothetical protein
LRGGVEREVDSLEGEFISRQARGIHQNNGCLSGTRATNEKSVKETDLLSALRAHLFKSTEFLNDVLDSLTVGSRDQELREYENSRRFPLSRLPVLPVACLGVDIIVINSFFVEVGTLSRDLRKSGVYALENFLVELSASHSPGLLVVFSRPMIVRSSTRKFSSA